MLLFHNIVIFLISYPNLLKVEEMRAELDRRRAKEEQLVNMEQEKQLYWDTKHADFCPVKVCLSQR